MFDDGARYLVKTQNKDGSWNAQGRGAGISALGALALLASGEDPNFGRYREPVRRALRLLVTLQDGSTGFIARGGHGSMYEHGFATLALAEAYGAVDESLLWGSDPAPEGRSLGRALELAVGAILTSQDQNPYGAWRYQPTSKDQDTSVSGAMLVALLAARNAGLEVPDKNIEKALEYFAKATLDDGTVMYSLGSSSGDSDARSGISCLVFALARRRDSDEHRSTLEYLSERMENSAGNRNAAWPHYTRYYVAQALFQGDLEAWEKWNELNTLSLSETQGDDGNLGGDPYSTAMCMLSMALNYRFLPIYER